MTNMMVLLVRIEDFQEDDIKLLLKYISRKGQAVFLLKGYCRGVEWGGVNHSA